MVAAGHPRLGGGAADASAFRAFRLLSEVAQASFLCGAGALPPPPGVRLFQPFGPDEFLAEAEAGFDPTDATQHDLNLLDRLGDLLRRLAPDVVHLHDLAPFGVEFLAMVRRECPQARIVLTLGAELARRLGITEPEREAVPRFLRAALLRRFLREATILLPNAALRAACESFGLDPARLVVSPPLAPEVVAIAPPPSRHALVAMAYPGPDDLATLAAAVGLLAASPLPGRLRIEAAEHPALEGAAVRPGSPLALLPAESSDAMAAAHLVFLPSRDAEPLMALAAAHRRPAIAIGSGADMAETLLRLLEAPEELAALQAATPPPPDAAEAAAGLLALYRGLPA